MSEIYCAITIRESTGALIGIRTPGPDLPAEGVPEQADRPVHFINHRHGQLQNPFCQQHVVPAGGDGVGFVRIPVRERRRV